MTLSQKIISARKLKGLTQEELAGLTNITVRTIQRIESGESIPRNYTLKSIAKVLDIPFEQLSNGVEAGENNTLTAQAQSAKFVNEDIRHFLQVLCLSAFSYIIVPYVHFLIPSHMLKKRQEQNQQAVAFARKFIRGQIGWVVITHLLFLLTALYNLLQAAYFNKSHNIHFLWPLFFMYILNAVIILNYIRQTRRMQFVKTPSANS